jgi:hypothetical protein
MWSLISGRQISVSGCRRWNMVGIGIVLRFRETQQSRRAVGVPIKFDMISITTSFVRGSEKAMIFVVVHRRPMSATSSETL